MVWSDSLVDEGEIVGVAPQFGSGDRRLVEQRERRFGIGRMAGHGFPSS